MKYIKLRQHKPASRVTLWSQVSIGLLRRKSQVAWISATCIPQMGRSTASRFVRAGKSVTRHPQSYNNGLRRRHHDYYDAKDHPCATLIRRYQHRVHCSLFGSGDGGSLEDRDNSAQEIYTAMRAEPELKNVIDSSANVSS